MITTKESSQSSSTQMEPVLPLVAPTRWSKSLTSGWTSPSSIMMQLMMSWKKLLSILMEDTCSQQLLIPQLRSGICARDTFCTRSMAMKAHQLLATSHQVVTFSLHLAPMPSSMSGKAIWMSSRQRSWTSHLAFQKCAPKEQQELVPALQPPEWPVQARERPQDLHLAVVVTLRAKK